MKQLKKDITFIYLDTAEKLMYQPIAEEAIKRGYSVHLSDNPLQKCEIGFYIEHVNYPQFSNFSVIMLHDLLQGYLRWPNIWKLEPWDKYDIGFLPTEQMVNNWVAASDKHYAKPRLGVYKAGWPKADIIANIDRSDYKKDFYSKYGLSQNKKTVLYAPAWENDRKQDDFVRAMQKLDVNMLIKQADVENVFPHIAENIREMYELHRNIKNVTILPPQMNIFEAILASDILVSEESSTMAEAEMLGIPAVSVSNWLIPDVKPSRFPSCHYDFVFMVEKEKLTDFVQNILDNYDEYKMKVNEYRNKVFFNIGNTSSIIMDIIDDCVANRPIRYSQIQPKPIESITVHEYVSQKIHNLRHEVSGNYAKRYKFIGIPWTILRKIKHILQNQKTVLN